jgi:uncharacterized protein with HEPN domain
MEAIEEFIGEMKYDEFISDSKTQSAVVRQLEVIGEASNNLPPEILKKYNAVPWEDMIGMRNVLIHQYFGVDYALVWKTIREIIPTVKNGVKAVIKDMGK